MRCGKDEIIALCSKPSFTSQPARMRCGKVAPLLCPNRKLRKHELRSSFLVSPPVILVVTFYMTAQLLKRFSTCTAKTAASKLSDAAVYSFNKWTRVNRARRNHGVIPTRQAETQSKLFCIDHLIPFGFIWYQLSQSYGVPDFLLSKSYRGMLST